MFTEGHGMVTCMVRVSHGRRGGGRTALWQILSLVDVNLDYRPTREMQTVGEAVIAEPWQSIPYHPMKAAIAMFLGDFLYHSLRSEGENAALFAFLENSLHWLDATERGIADFHVQLMLRLTRFLGILPSAEERGRNMVYDLRGAGYVTLVPEHGQYLIYKEARWIPLLLAADYGRMPRMTTPQRRRLMEVILMYYRLHLPGFGELESLDVLREIFS